MRRSFDLSLYLVTDRALCAARGVVETVSAAIDGGVTMVQLRDKEASDAELVELARALKRAMAGSGAALMVNDRVEVALAAGVDGAHVGQTDMAADNARELLGDDAIIGLSVDTDAQARAVDPAIVDYAGLGPIFATPTKPDYAEPIGSGGLARRAAMMTIPSVAIGGIGVDHVRPLIGAGAAGVAVVSAICAAADPAAAARGFAAELAAARS